MLRERGGDGECEKNVHCVASRPFLSAGVPGPDAGRRPAFAEIKCTSLEKKKSM